MTENASPFFIRPHRFDDPDQDDTYFPRLDWHRRLVLDTDERVLWRDRVEVAGYLLAPDAGPDELAWALPQPAEVIVTDRRLCYVCLDCHLGPAPGLQADSRHRRRTGPAGSRVVTGQIRWQWPAGLRVLSAGTGPETDPGTAGERLLVVCDAVRATGRPALALSGGPLDSPQRVRRLATVIRRAVAGFRLANPAMVELAPPEWDALLSRAGLALHADALADPRRGVDLPGSLPVEFAHRDDYYRRSLRRRNAPTPSRSSAPPTGNSSAPGAGSPTPGRNLSPSGRNSPAPGRLPGGPPARWSERQPGSAS
ncbi:hypothetical protein GCM10022225_60870 [Plantactinospora mayteni]|uniref:Uncharacterized protein n=1 Tax=Plantactinospora mayteni TaxID=566021 RepID=A0ABQ4EZV3_9ACTN|nr:hypothetical protein [Plantactinospora mayteni]GIH00171.1 hypothetical protein Pma05_67430 [Plantactinospora mayteni]